MSGIIKSEEHGSAWVLSPGSSMIATHHAGSTFPRTTMIWIESRRAEGKSDGECNHDLLIEERRGGEMGGVGEGAGAGEGAGEGEGEGEGGRERGKTQ